MPTVITVGLVLGQATLAYGDPIMTIDDAVARALAEGPAMRMAAASISAKEEELKAARREMAPSLSAEVTAMRGSGEPTSFFGVNSRRDPENPAIGNTTGNYGSATLLFNVPIYQSGVLFYETSPAERVAQSDYDKARADGSVEAADLANQVAKAYLDALSASEELSLQQGAQERLQRRLEYVRQRVRNNLAGRVDELTAEAALAAKATDVNAARRRYELQRRQLAAALRLGNQPLGQFSPLIDSLPALPPIERVAEEVLVGQPSLRSQEAELRGAEAQLAVAQGESAPKVSFFASATQASNLSESGSSSFNVAGVKLSMPLIESGQKSAQARAKGYEVQQADQKLVLLRDTLVQATYAAYYSCLDAQDKMEATSKAVAQAQFQEQSTTAKYEKGLVGLDTALQDAAIALNARIELVKGRYAAWAAYADLVKSLGRPFASRLILTKP